MDTSRPSEDAAEASILSLSHSRTCRACGVALTCNRSGRCRDCLDSGRPVESSASNAALAGAARLLRELGHIRAGRLPAATTDAVPGTPRKIEVMAERVGAGELPCHPADDPADKRAKAGSRTTNGRSPASQFSEFSEEVADARPTPASLAHFDRVARSWLVPSSPEYLERVRERESEHPVVSDARQTA
jgi:hypothetical protein